MDRDISKIQDIIEQTSHAHSDSERLKLSEEANKIHEKATGHSMKISKDGNIDVTSTEARQCPCLRLS